MVASQLRQCPLSGTVFAAHRKGSPVDDRHRLDECLQRDRIVRVFLGQLQESQRMLRQTRLDLLAFLGSPDL